MFINLSGQLRLDAETLTEAIRSLPSQDETVLSQSKETLRGALTAFETQLRRLTPRDRQVTLGLLYQRFADVLFDFQLSLLTTESRERIARAKCREEKLRILREFRTSTEELAMLYGVK